MTSTASTLWARRHLLWVLVASTLKRQNRNSALGYAWWLLDPLMMTGVYFMLVSVLFKRGVPGVPYLLFLVCGLLPWKAFADSVNQSVSSVRSQAAIVRAISFPKAVLPLSQVLANAVYLSIALLVPFGLALAYGPGYGTWPSGWYVFLPAIISVQLIFTAGVALLVATVGLYFADTQNIVGHLLRMWYFLSPGLYAIERVPEHLRTLFRLNPFAGIMTSYRAVIIHGRPPEWYDVAWPLALGLVALAVGWGLFRHYEGQFVQRL